MSTTLDPAIPRNLLLDQGQLEVKGLWWEPGRGDRKAPLRALRSALESYRIFLGAESYRLPKRDLRSCRA